MYTLYLCKGVYFWARVWVFLYREWMLYLPHSTERSEKDKGFEIYYGYITILNCFECFIFEGFIHFQTHAELGLFLIGIR